MILFNQLPEKDKKLIEVYAKRFSYTDFNIGLEKFLKEWDSQNRKLYKLLGNQFIYEFPYSNSEIHYDNIEEELKDLLEYPFVCYYQDLINKVANIHYNKYDLSFSDSKVEAHNYHFWSSTYSLLNTNSKECLKALSNNTINDSNINIYSNSLTINEKKILELLPGMKLSKIIKRLLSIIEKYYLPDYPSLQDIFNNCKATFEEFRIKLSIIIASSQKKDTTLCISIHPLDFMTMSDNGNNWTSCMSWKEKGCYFAGTYEMMNSNCTLVVYEKSNKNTTKIARGVREWNSKSWRTLVVFTKHAIISGKQYPDHSDNTVKTILEKIKELAKENLGWEFTGETEKYNSRYDDITLSTELMYNDFSHADYYNHYYIIRKNPENNKCYNFSFSGKCFCLTCGKRLLDSYEDEGCLSCNSCRTNSLYYRQRRECCECRCEDDMSRMIRLDNDKELYACHECYKNIKTDIETNEEIPSKYKVVYSTMQEKLVRLDEKLSDSQMYDLFLSRNNYFIPVSEDQFKKLINMDKEFYPYCNKYRDYDTLILRTPCLNKGTAKQKILQLLNNNKK